MSEAMGDFLKSVDEELVPKLADSYVAAALVPHGKNKVDAKFAVELGCMIMLNKPIVLIARADEDIPPKLRLVADRVIVGDVSTEGERIQQEVRQFIDDVDAANSVS